MTKVTNIDKTYGRKSTTIIGNFNITFSVMGENIQRIMSKLREDLNNTVNQMYLKTFYPTKNILLFLKCTWKIFWNTGGETSNNRFNTVEFIPNIFSDQKKMKLEIL